MENKIPPPIILLITGVVMWLVAHSPIGYRVVIPYPTLLASVFVAIGFSIAFLALREFRAVDTTVNPLQPESATSLVDSGIFARSRNPMYLGLFCIAVGWGLWLGSLSNVVVLTLFVFAITKWQIKPEEEALRKLFGADFEAYCQRVRRWL